MGATAAIVGATVAVYNVYESSQNAKRMAKDSKNQMATQAATQARQEQELKDRTANEKSLENAKISRQRNQSLSMGGATKNGTIKTTAIGTGANPLGGGKTLLGL